ncbi:winged helix-turn-helix transcriptional regulator [Paracoccus sp. R12_1]|uniref:winged helix-turn-helix transcriptional regulator n=1 Tax=unclassified Paracoccus (in: a-proteobacteria) TaxID=2688777 RepID=UPI001ADCBA02|nr:MULTISPECIES: winged helix-turn-helix transcriptional regulator [unclassified Paracoccus (in: a-proteobacteria)]MBO9456515.1 winged helix-turn-helix transcriptional regulator [Paracoccus sp. R12_2]MBO9487634.1 winged helix-turn-helix transcriptional regulator [Paracoccus sp. R12_1]
MTKTGDSTRIRYDEGCLAAHALNVIGDRWALLVVRELMLTPRRFQAIRAGLPGITAAVLTQRLTQLRAADVVDHDPDLGVYSLTAAGQALLPVLQAMCRWGALHPGHDPRRFISPTALMLSMTAMIDTTAARGRVAVGGFQAGSDRFVMRLQGDGVARPEAVRRNDADFVLEGSGNTLARAVYGATPLAELVASGVVALAGDRVAAQDFVDLFRLR